MLDTYWRFAAERQEVFFRRARGEGSPWTSDPILQTYKFTNAYRASDRVSQFLIRSVLYDKERPFEDVFFRAILFKLFNKIETWELLTDRFGEIDLSTFSVHAFDRCLSDAMGAGKRVYSAAYIMPTGGKTRFERKHQLHLALLARMIRDSLPARLQECGSMEQAYKLFLACDTIGPFLAYQYATDLNYSSHLDFDEMEFVQPGPGARDGLRKCFVDFGEFSESDVIRLVADEQFEAMNRLGLEFRRLGERPLQLIDCQNLFCEVDKYARVKHPEVVGLTGRTRIKQKFSADRSPVEYMYPPKWAIDTKSLARAV